METLPAVKSHMPVMNIAEAAERRNAIVEFRQHILVAGTDYGVIPGTGKKPVLLKPGAEKLCTYFGLAPKFILTDKTLDWTGKEHNNEPFFYFQYTCELWHKGEFVGEGAGNCNSWEKKYRYRRDYNTREYVKNPDIADIVNTLDKMAQKRALVAAILIAINASEFFTQDLEDLPRDVTPQPVDRRKKVPISQSGDYEPTPEPDDVPPWPTRDEYSPPEGLKLDTPEAIDNVIRTALIRQGVIPEDTEVLIDRTLGNITKDHAEVAKDLWRWSRLSALWFNKYAAILRERAGISTDEYRAYMEKCFPDVERSGKLTKAQQQQTINWLSVAVEEPRDLTYASVASAVIQMTGMKAVEVGEWLMDTFGMGVDSDMALLEMVSKTISDYDPAQLREELRSFSLSTEAP